MTLPKIETAGAAKPVRDGEVNEYAYREAVASRHFDANRKVIFINGMANSGPHHTEAALALSWVQMCKVIGVYNRSGGAVSDLIQCVGDKNQFNGLSLSAARTVTVRRLIAGQTSIEAARAALARNACQVALFDVLRTNPSREIFAHSQGNLILSNVLQARAAVFGRPALAGLVVNTFGSPAVNWPAGLTVREHGFTFDPVNWLSGFDSTWSISKVGWPSGSWNPITHAFLEYMRHDPTFLVNRFRTGGLGVTFNMDEAGLAGALLDMGGNMRRVGAVFRHLADNHSSDSDDVAELYVDGARSRPSVVAALTGAPEVKALLIRILSSGVTFRGEQRAIGFLRSI